MEAFPTFPCEHTMIVKNCACWTGQWSSQELVGLDHLEENKAQMLKKHFGQNWLQYWRPHEPDLES